MAKEDDIATSLTHLSRLKAKNRTPTAAKESAKKSKVDTEAQVAQLLQDKVDLKKDTFRG